MNARTSIALFFTRVVAILFLAPATLLASPRKSAQSLWSLAPLTHPSVPVGRGAAPNPIDSFLAVDQEKKGLAPLPPAAKQTLLRRVCIDLTGLPPTIAAQEQFLNDHSPGAYDAVVDQLLANPQYGAAWARHWLDVLRYADIDENMPAAGGIYLWRDWIIRALNDDLPYDAFARAQISGERFAVRTAISATGYRSRLEPRPDDLFALGFLSRGAVTHSNKGEELAVSAVETISTAFMGMTVGCAKCHDHMYDPVTQADFYSMKSLFDPLALRPVRFATAEQTFAYGQSLNQYEAQKRAIDDQIDALAGRYKEKLFQERLAMLPPDVQTVIRKPEKTRNAAEQKIADDYYPILRIDPEKIREVLPKETARQYDTLLKKRDQLKVPDELAVFWTVEEDRKRTLEKSYVLNSGDPERPEKDKPVQPGFPFAPKNLEFREGRRETFTDWLTAPENPLFTRVVVNRIWQWHFGEGLHRNASDFGTLGGKPVHPELLDWLANEFVAHHYSMKWLHRLIVTSQTFQRASFGPSSAAMANERIDPQNQFLWKFSLHRLEAEPIWDAIFFAAGTLDLAVGGASYLPDEKSTNHGSFRRAVYLQRGYKSSQEVMPQFLASFDTDDGRAPCPRRNQTVTAPQALFLMNNPLVHQACEDFGDRLRKLSGDNLDSAVDLGYRLTLARLPVPAEKSRALEFLQQDPARLKSFAWILFNLDEFVFLR